MRTYWSISTLACSIIAFLVTIWGWKGSESSGITIANDVSPRKNGDIEIQDSVQDRVELWQFFETRVLQVKSTLLTMIGWIITIDVALLGFILKQWVPDDSGCISQPALVFLGIASIIGCLVNFGAEKLIWEYGGHIWRNGKRADRSRITDNKLDYIIGTNGQAEDKLQAGQLPQICKHLRYAVWTAMFFFLSSSFLAILQLIVPTFDLQEMISGWIN